VDLIEYADNVLSLSIPRAVGKDLEDLLQSFDVGAVSTMFEQGNVCVVFWRLEELTVEVIISTEQITSSIKWVGDNVYVGVKRVAIDDPDCFDLLYGELARILRLITDDAPKRSIFEAARKLSCV